MAVALFAIFFGLSAINVPIAVALALAAAIPLLMYTDLPLIVVVQRFFTATDSFPFMAIPFFMIAGGLLEKGGVSKRLVNLASAMVGGLHGGLAIVTFVASAFFGAISGSSTATVIAIGSIMIPAMLSDGYGLKFSLATVASAGYLGVIIPPSIPMVTYGISSGTSISDIFMAGFLPGILLTASMSVYAYYYGKKHVPTTRKFTIKEFVKCFKDAIWALMMPGIILGGIYGGVFTPTEAAAVACLYGLIVGFCVYKELTWPIVYDIMKGSVVSAAMIMFIVAGASAFGFVMTRELIPARVAEYIVSISSSPIMFLMLVNVLLLIVGTFMETNAAILILTPIFVPICQQMNIDLIAFGIVVVVNLAIGTLTPPLGVNLFVAARLKNAKIDTVVNVHLGWYIVASVFALMVLTFVPSISLFLPNLLK
ncbi:MAG: TRAP transporter large permease [Negativicutes bacterium]